MPEGNQGPQDAHEQATVEVIRQIKKAQTLVTIATIAAPVSLLFGGVLLSTVALICAIIGWNKLKKISASNPQASEHLAVAFKSTRMTIIMCVVALGLNAISLAVMYPSYMELLESTDLSALEGVGSATQTPQTTAPSSVWG